ncbi:hypothetical protein, partial [Rhizobium leguminosarum]|uniref:hypothetical protein n=1 Tax=Rhizobium leguminosarum TaxID=384 RepID=UPI003F990EFB
IDIDRLVELDRNVGGKAAGRLDKNSITVPEKLPTSLREIDIRHKNAPRAVLAQLRDDCERKPGEKSSVITLDLEIDAPSHIFGRGRGIDAELGG